MKTCTRCGTEYPATAEYFVRSKQTKSGLVSHCKRCQAERLREWQRKNPDKVREYNAKARANDPERVRKYTRDYRARQRDQLRQLKTKLKERDAYIAELEAQLMEATA